MSSHDQQEEEFSFKSLFVPFTTTKAIHWIIVIGLLVYFNSLFNGFVGDDDAQILTNPTAHSITNIFSFFKGSTLYLSQASGNVGLYYRPMLSTVLSIIYSLFGANPFFFHAIQLLFHISNVVL
ncbi:MAG: hypothetical protein ACREHC_03495, partial [Candidatus Levyibacteriota bacterium]